MRNIIAGCIVPALLVLGGCRKADVNGPDLRTPGSGTYIVNEGGFGGGGNLSFYDPSTGAVSNDVIRNAENWLFPNDILFFSGKMYVAINGSDRVSVIDPETDSVRITIEFPPGTGPGFLVAGDNRIYSSNYNGTVTAIDPVGDTLLGSSARVVGFPGDILVTEGKIFVSDLGAWPDTGTSMKVLDQGTLTVLDSVSPGGGPAQMTLAGGKLYLGTAVAKKIWRIDPVTLAIEDSSDLGSVPGDLATDGIHLYVLTQDAVERIPINVFERDSVPLIRRTDGLFHYALGYDEAAGELYISNITTAGGSGEIGVYTRTGVPVRPPFPGGIFPGAFGFYRAGLP